MSRPDLEQMTDKQLRAYVLANRQDAEAFYLYVERMRQKPPIAVLGPDDPLPPELIKRLEAEGRKFRSRGDTDE
ncbi:DUF6887 family protein [Gloeobacter morelensis]|uniref:Uncharacterized protein n=1 Tax=Gloeobacter morelensis MG652769 TaxID=2781736 RepID=A0ABY3PKC4_9CYAN|nr:hypothetical protein [Gloeobacter morelensis]UFP94102.1 hypothetical protein ISF26_20425 [Gloeobacter morelensis MG652769]